MLRLICISIAYFLLSLVTIATAQPINPGLSSSQVIDITNYPGIVLGECTGTTAACHTQRLANGTALNTIFATASGTNNNTVITGYTVACPTATRIEFESPTGLLVAQGNFLGIRVRFNPSCQFYQFTTNAPVITIGNVVQGYYSENIDWDGGDFEYGVSQTGNPYAVCVLLGGMTNSRISNMTICGNLNSAGPVNPPSIALSIGPPCYNGAAAFYTNTLSRLQIGGAQYELIGRYISGTGNLFSDILAHNGGQNSSAQPLTAFGVVAANATLGFPACGWYLPAALNINPQGASISDDEYLRLNLEHFKSLWGVLTQNVTDTSFIAMHMEDVTLTGYGPTVWLLAGSQIKII